MKLKQKWVTMAAKSEKNDKDTLRNIINFISDIIKNNHKDRSWSQLLNKAMLNLGKDQNGSRGDQPEGVHGYSS